jgi:catechol 2,3-dioxygenase-like lactoylglutathione lyase family enzyme
MVAIYTGIYLLVLLAFFVGKELLRRSRVKQISARHLAGHKNIMRGGSSMSVPEFKFDAVYYHVSDIERSIAFYRDILGFRLASRDYVARFDLDGVLFELVPNPPGNALRGSGNARLSLGVTDIQQATRDLQGKGVTTTQIKEEPGGMLSFFQDPDGNELCLWQAA